MRFRVGFLLRDIPNKDVSTQEPRRTFGRAIVNKASLLYGGILSPAFNHLPLKGRDTRIGSAGSTQRQTFGSSKFHPDLASSAPHVDDAQESLRALQESADASPNPHLKSAVSGVSALWQIAKRVERSKEAQAWSERSLNVLETLAEAVGHDPLNIPPLVLEGIGNFEKLLLEIRNAMEPPMEQSRISRPFRSNRRGNGFNDFDKRLSELQQKFEEACSQRSQAGLDTPSPSVSTGALRLPRDPYSHTLESKPFRRRFLSPGLKSRLGPVSSTCADVASTTLKVLEKAAGSAVPIVSGAVSGVSALLDTAKRVKQSKERAQALSQHSTALAEAVDHDRSNTSLALSDVFVSELSEVPAAVLPIMERGWISRLFRLNRNEDILDTSDHRLNEAWQRYMVGNVTQIRTEVSQFRKHTTDNLNTLIHRLLLSNVLF